MKKQFFFLFFFILSILACSSLVRATEYECSLQEDTVIKYKVKEYDEDGLEAIFGDSYQDFFIGIEADARSQMKITKIDEEADGWTIIFDLWDWYRGGGSLPKTPDVEDVEGFMPDDPSDLGYIEGWGGFWVPTNIEDYLNECNFSNDIEVDGNSVSMEMKKSSTGLDEDFEQTSTYNEETGWLKIVQIKNKDGDIVLEYSTIAAVIPGYEISIIFGVSIVSIIGAKSHGKKSKGI